MCRIVAIDSVPIYVQVGAILGIVSGISGAVYVILHLAQLLGTIRSFLKWLYRWLKGRGVLFKQWRWWKRTHAENWGARTGSKGKIVNRQGKWDTLKTRQSYMKSLLNSLHGDETFLHNTA